MTRYYHYAKRLAKKCVRKLSSYLANGRVICQTREKVSNGSNAPGASMNGKWTALANRASVKQRFRNIRQEFLSHAQASQQMVFDLLQDRASNKLRNYDAILCLNHSHDINDVQRKTSCRNRSDQAAYLVSEKEANTVGRQVEAQLAASVLKSAKWSNPNFWRYFFEIFLMQFSTGV